jgi:hypothetical protein
MFKRKPSPELEAIRALTDEIKAVDAERKSTLERLVSKLAITDSERRAFKALLLTDERRDCPAVYQMRINR